MEPNEAENGSEDEGAEVRNAADPRQLREAKKREKIDARLTDEDLKWVMSSEPGRRFVNNLLEECHVFGLRFDGRVNWLLFDTGMREIGNRVMARARTSAPDQFAKMVTEADQRAKARAERRKAKAKEKGEQETLEDEDVDSRR
jgi:hypothetical protein